jgi:predicted anti-sigma-YlaC factor YlaD
MKCSVAKQLMSAYLDGAVSRQEMAEIQGHLRNCAACGARFESLQRAQRMVSSLGRKQAPPELVLRLRVALSQEVANSRRSRLESLRIRWENLLDAIMVPATAGLVTTIIIFGLLMSFLVPGQMTASNDVPTMLYTPPQLEFAPYALTKGVANAE